ncbi:glycosyltransferase family 4 protein [Kroppenstedtia pulmonis]|uniref:Glycosyltransferase family 4 protein n=1 Tax=Kroppenstedtia pulmonis TaxID=1380685 RepID=A0A7D3XRG6_9BACL|nr:glycosyltransferase [Kroppenstedtia pulmonis]QKG85647.1 glycosyltransferase family 4 protein [Kroppenstedtia pulmonis]
MMRVLMTLFKDIHYDSRAQREALALAEAGWEVDIACLHTTTQPPPELHEKIRLLRFPIHTKQLKRYVDRKADQRVRRGVYRVIRTPFVKMAKDVMTQRQFALKIWGLCEEAAYDVVHCHEWSTLSIGVYLKRKMGYTLVYDSRELFEGDSKGRWERIVGNRTESWWMEDVDELITVSSMMGTELKKKYPHLSATVVRTIPDSLETLPERKDYFHRLYGLDPNDRIVLYQGSFFRNRGLEALIGAFTYLKEDRKLVLLGYGDWKERLEKLVRDKGLEGRVFFHPPLFPENLVEVIAHADLGTVLYPGMYLNNRLSSPAKLFEYIQAGIPVLSSDQPGKAAIVGHYGTGKLVQSVKPRGIAEAIDEVLENPDPYLIGTHKARKLLTWEKEQQNLLWLYEQLERSMDRKECVSIHPHLREL